jgi:ABC-type transport system involved in multi-copper enzyme maturation permease subunit
MLVLALLIGQALGLPEVENPIPERIGLSYLVSLAGAGGVLGAVASVARPQKRELFVSVGTFLGFCLGCGLYALSLAVQLLFAE